MATSSCTYAHAEPCYSNEIQYMLPSVHQSRPLYRFSNQGLRLVDSLTNNIPDMNARMTDIRKVEEELRMESMMLKQNNNIPMGRSSTPNPAYCYHCEHKHRGRCCLYVGDEDDDINRYSAWTQELKNPSVKPQNIPQIPEAVSGNSTPYWFPRFTCAKPEQIKQIMQQGSPPPIADWSKQFYHPLLGYNLLQNMVNPSQPEPPTPYREYMLQMQQMNQKSPQQQGCQYGHRHHHNPNEAYQGIPFIQQFHTHHVYNGPVYIQQHNQSPSFHQSHYHYHPNQQPQNGYFPYQMHPTPPIQHAPQPTPIGYSYGGQQYMHQAQEQHYAPQYSNPAAQVHSEGISFPLWMLFCQKKASVGMEKSPPHMVYPNGIQLDQNSNVHQIAGCAVPVNMESDTQVEQTCQHQQQLQYGWKQ